MKKNTAVFGAVCALGLLAIPYGKAQDSSAASKLDAAGLKAMITNLGYTLKDLNTEPGKEKFEFAVEKEGFNIPIAAEISPSKNFVWLTCFLGKYTDLKDPKDRAEKALRQNQKMQPTFFYVTDKDNLMIGTALENRALDASIMKRFVDKLGADVSSSSAVWGQ